jgi:hypothetical protein
MKSQPRTVQRPHRWAKVLRGMGIAILILAASVLPALVPLFVPASAQRKGEIVATKTDS